jgi:hypothetical protein
MDINIQNQQISDLFFLIQQLRGGIQTLEVSGTSLSIQLTEGGMNNHHYLSKTSG